MSRPVGLQVVSAGLALLLLFLSLAGVSLAQSAAEVADLAPSTGLAQGAQPLSQVAVVTMPPVDNAALLAEDAQNAGPGVAPRFALPIPVQLTPANSGSWETLPDGDRLWRLRIQSPGAVSLNLGFTRYWMPAGGQLLLSTSDGATVRGPFTAADNEAHGQLWTPILFGDEVVVAVRLPAGAEEGLELELTSVNHGYTDFAGAQAILSGSCNLDVVCGADDGFPQVEPWRDQIRSVAVISTGGGTFCTGFLVNNTAQDLTPYFMTAQHCGITSGNAPSLVAYWNYENSWCRLPGSPASGGPGDGSLAQFNTGSIWRSSYSPSDFTLVELDDPPDPVFNVYWAGWDRSSADAFSAVGIHHPNTDEKRISFENDPTQTTSYLGNSSPGDGTHVRVVDWDLGTTEPGSSGSPLFNQSQRIIGQLHGGYAACGNDSSDWYGRISVSWNGGGSPSTGLSNWLDPEGTGTVALNGTDALGDFTLAAASAQQTICLGGEAHYTIEVAPRGNFAEPVTLNAPDSPGLAVFAPNPVTPPGASLLTIAAAPAGAHVFGVQGAFDVISHTTPISLTVLAGAPVAPALLSPADGAVGVDRRPTLGWSAAAGATAGYHLQIALDPAFALLAVEETGIDAASYAVADTLLAGTTYYWRMRSANLCGDGAWSAAASFTVQPQACLLLVDDDSNSPNVRGLFSAALDALEADYDAFDVGSGAQQGPDLAYLRGYGTVVWFSGDKQGSLASPAAGPNGADEAALATYLDQGGRLFLSSQDYLHDRGVSSFADGYLGVASFDERGANSATSLWGIAGDPIGDGFGMLPLAYPVGWSKDVDEVEPRPGASMAFRPNLSFEGAILDVDGGAWRTVFAAAPFEAVAQADSGNGQALLGRILEWFGPCQTAYWADLNQDCRVDIGDILQTSTHWNTAAGDPGYSLSADQDADGDVDVWDVALTASQWGWVCGG